MSSRETLSHFSVLCEKFLGFAYYKVRQNLSLLHHINVFESFKEKVGVFPEIRDRSVSWI